MMPTASAPSAAIARSTTASIAGSASLPSPSRASAGRLTSLSSRLQARPPPSRGKSRLMRPGASAGTRNRHSFPAAPLLSGDTRRDDDLPGGIAVEHGGLPAVEAPALRRLRWPWSRPRRDRSAPRVPNARTPDRANRRRSSAAAPASAPRCRIHRSAPRRSRPWRDRARKPARARTLPSGYRSRPRRRRARHRLPVSAAPASRVRRTASRSRAEAERIARQPAAMIGVVGLADKAFGTFTQQPLLVAQGKVHMFYFADRRFPDGGMEARGIHHHSELLEIMRVTELMQRERLLDRRGLSHHIDRAIDRLLGQLQRKRWLRRDPLAPAPSRTRKARRAARRD